MKNIEDDDAIPFNNFWMMSFINHLFRKTNMKFIQKKRVGSLGPFVINLKMTYQIVELYTISCEFEMTLDLGYFFTMIESNDA